MFFLELRAQREIKEILSSWRLSTDAIRNFRQYILRGDVYGVTHGFTNMLARAMCDTQENVREMFGLTYKWSAIDKWCAGMRPGDTPPRSVRAKKLLEWVNETLKIHEASDMSEVIDDLIWGTNKVEEPKEPDEPWR